MPDMLIHATCVAIDDKCVLLAGEPGSGKSDTALRLVDRGAKLVADDQTKLEIIEGRLIASAPPSISGMMEVRHVGVLRMPFCASAPVALFVDLVNMDEKIDRLPELDHILLLDQQIPRLRLYGHAVSTPAKIRAAIFYPTATSFIET
ncbi:MAG: HPr kinase/phosphatase C-terminal domain-containing protein [Alphaproteobacteria bacterium]|nr:HPr kinase/phosphatase C-terminal domain-containing protein [Alphaproteobacteria bacterium]